MEIFNLYNKVNYQLLGKEKYVYFLIKQCLSFRGKYNENLVIDKTDEKVLPKLKDNNTYLDEVKKSVGIVLIINYNYLIEVVMFL